MDANKVIGVRLPPEITHALESDARAAGVTSSEYLRHLVLGHYGSPLEDERQQRVIYEIAKNRSVLLRFIDAQLGEAKADDLLRAAEQDARAYIESGGNGADGGEA